MNKIAESYTALGGQFITEAQTIAEKLPTIKAWLFDWDGVWNAGNKGEGAFSTFSEPDSMGLNMLRFGYYMNAFNMPMAGIITGENNPSAIAFSRRESLHSVYFQMPSKIEALDHFCRDYRLQHHEVAFVFDDILDFGLAKKVGLRVLVNRRASSIAMQQYCVANSLVDYITANEGGNHAVRELSELIMSMMGVYDQAITNRMNYTELYQRYIMTRQRIQPSFFTKDGMLIKQV